MTERQRVRRWTGWAVQAVMALLLAAGVITFADPVSAQVPVPVDPLCVNPTGDTDNDGFTDAVECTGFETAGSTKIFFPNCTNPQIPAGKTPASNNECVNPGTMDVFVIYKPLASGSLLGGLPRPFATNTFNGITFRGLSDLGLTVHQLTSAQAASDRRVSSVSTEKAVRVTESLNVNGGANAALGYCQFGTPQGLDGCTVYTQRAMNFINTTCPNDPANNQAFLAYANYIILHEVGHTLGGLAAQYDAAFGGYHYAPTAGLVMSQTATVNTTGGQCVWSIPSTWNTVLDPPGVRLK